MCVKPNVIVQKNDEELMQLARHVTREYSEDISDELSDQLLLLKLTFLPKLMQIRSVKELAELLLIRHSELSTSFSEIITACLLYLTLPVTVATAERSFSKLELIKSAFTHDDRYDDRFANLCKLSGRSLADCISMVLTARVDFTKYHYLTFFNLPRPAATATAATA